MTAGRLIRWSAVVVAVVAGIAGWVSYVHAYDVIRSHGEAGLVGRVYPGTVDALIYCASMVLLDAARRGVRAPVIARWLLAGGIGATLFANILAGLSYGPLGAVVAAWPALALVGSYELLMALVRGQAAAKAGDTGPAAVATVAASAEEAARLALQASIAAGNPVSRRALASRFGMTRPAAARLHREVTAASNGHMG